jgi:hypothetical protein
MIGRRRVDAFVIGDEGLFGDRDSGDVSDGASGGAVEEPEDGWVPFEDEAVRPKASRGARRPSWLRRALVGGVFVAVGAFAVSRLVLSGGSASVSVVGSRHAGGPLVLGSQVNVRRRSAGPRVRVPVEAGNVAGRRPSPRRRRRRSGEGDVQVRAEAVGHGGGQVFPPTGHSGSEQASADALEVREPVEEAAPEGAAVQAPVTEAPTPTTSPETDPEPAPAAVGPARSEGGGSGTDDFGFER